MRVLWPIVVSLTLSACAGLTAPSKPASPVGSTPATSALAAASEGLCVALVALPDAASAERDFVNHAHDQLHALAAAPGLDHAISARVLEAMNTVEGDFAESIAEHTLASDLATLLSATDDALRALGIAIPPCGR